MVGRGIESTILGARAEVGRHNIEIERLNKAAGLLARVAAVLPSGDAEVGVIDGDNGAAPIIGPYAELTHEEKGDSITTKRGLRVGNSGGFYSVGAWKIITGRVQSGEGFGTRHGISELDLPLAVNEEVGRLFPGQQNEGLRSAVEQVLFPQPQTS